MAGRFKKYIAALLIVFLMLYNTMFPAVIFADEITPTPTIEQSQEPQPEQQEQQLETSVENTSETENLVDTSSNTGDNAINPTPTPTPSEVIEVARPLEEVMQEQTKEQQQSEEIVPENLEQTESTPQENNNQSSNPQPNSPSVENNADVDNSINSQGESGENEIATASANTVTDTSSNSCSTPNGENASISTGDAVSETAMDNNVNTNSINSEVVYNTINIFVGQNGNLNLSDPFAIASTMIPEHPNDEVINISFTDINNYAYLSNNVNSYANTGGNTINAISLGDQTVINTGNAYSIVSLVNKVNFTVINSVIHIVSINIFGSLNGNIILPDFTQSTSCATCGVTLVASNSATVVNNVDSQSISGQNTINGNGSINTGDAASLVNNLNIVNTNFVGTTVQGLFINLVGNWSGNFIGWNAFDPKSGGATLMFYSTGPLLSGTSNCPTCAVGDVSIYNSAYVENNVVSFANSGGNTINGNGNINTGSAFSTISLINFVNANFINSIGFFGFLNIFGDWTGDIGGKSNFDKLTKQDPNPDPKSQVQEESAPGDQKQEEGGQLSITSANNVGDFVYPGDTVTFFVKVKNIGSGKVYGTKVRLSLVKDGIVTGEGLFNLGDMEGGKSLKITTGLVLSSKAKPGDYTAVATAQGYIGPDNSLISVSSESTFKIFGNGSPSQAILTANTQNLPAVLGTRNTDRVTQGMTRDMLYLMLLVLVMSAYTGVRIARKKEYVWDLLYKKTTFKEKLHTLRMFLL